MPPPKTNGAAASARSSKRKASASPDQGPPSKRAINGKSPPEDAEYADVEYEYEDASELEDDLHAHPAMYVGTPGSLGEWRETIQKVVRNVVSIRFCQTCSFDTEPALTSEATGFVVDAERGYVACEASVAESRSPVADPVCAVYLDTS